MIFPLFLSRTDLSGSKILFLEQLIDFEGLIFSLYPDSNIDFENFIKNNLSYFKQNNTYFQLI